MPLNKLFANNIWAIASLLIVVLAGIICSHLVPTQTYAAIEGMTPYPWFFWVVSCTLLAIPLVCFLFSDEYKRGHWEEKLLWLSIALLATSTVHRPRLYIDLQVLFFIATVTYIIFHKPFTFNRPRALEWLIIAYLIWNVISLSWSHCPRFGGKLLNNMVPLLVYPLCFSFFRLKKEVVSRILLVLWQATLIAVTMSLVCACYEMRVLGLPITDLLTTHKQDFHNAEWLIIHYAYQMAFSWSGAEHPSYNAIWVIGAMISGFYLYKEKLLSALNGIVGTGLMVLLLCIIQSRIGVVMSAVTIACGIYYLSSHKKLCLGIYGLGILLAIVVAWMYPSLWQGFLSDPTRAQLFQIDYQYLTQDPWIGAGIGGMTSEHMCAMIPDFPFPQFEHWYPHNQLIGDWIQTGIVGLLLSLALYVGALVYAIRQKRFTAMVFIICMGLFSIIEMPFYMLSGITLITLYCCLFLCRLEPKNDKA